MIGALRGWMLGGVAALAATVARGAAVTISVDEIHAGMRGVVMTVLQSTNVVPVATEILGVQENGLGPGKHMIIGKLVDEKTQLTGAVHGMSGSPLYIGGRLAGALSRRVAIFEKDGHCGFTPIADMIETGGYLDGGPRPAQRFSVKSAVREGMLGSGILSEWLAIPFQVSGVREGAVRLLERLWEGTGMMLTAGGGGRGSDRPGGDLAPGAAVSAAMAVGDITMAGTGTLTWREGDRVLAFGHPMMGLGDVAMPMCEAEIITTIPSYQRPYKLANIRRVAGTVLQDRYSAIAGVVGAAPELPEYRIKIHYEGREPVERRGRFVAHPRIAPAVASSLVLDSVMSSENVGDELTVRVEGALRLRGHPAVRLDGFSSGDLGALLGATMGLRSRIERVLDQPFEEVVPEAMDVEVHVSPRREQARIESLTLWPRVARAGEAVRAEIALRNHWGGQEHREFRFEVPQEARPGESLTVEVNDERTLLDRDGGAGDRDSPSLGTIFSASRRRDEPEPRSLAELIEKMNRVGRSNVLMLRVTRAQEGFRDSRGRMEDMPGSVAAVLRNSTAAIERIGDAVVAEVREPTDRDLQGSAKARLTVQ